MVLFLMKVCLDITKVGEGVSRGAVLMKPLEQITT